MEVPFYLSFEEFQSQFKIDFVKISSDNTNITLIEYYENLKTHYENVLHNCKNAKKDLQYLKEKIVIRKKNQLSDKTFDINSEKLSIEIPEVILETDLLTKEEIKYACECAVKGGADFVKTSTGFVKGGVGAKVEDVELMYNTVKEAGMKVKASGGIRDRETAIKMIEAGASRLGTSSGVKIVGA